MVTHDSRISACCRRILYLLDGRIRGEFCPDSSMTYREREAAVSGWLTDMGW